MPQIHARKVSYEAPKSTDANVVMPKDYIGPQLEKIGKTLEYVKEKEDNITDLRVDSKMKFFPKYIIESIKKANPDSGNFSQFRDEAIFAFNEFQKQLPQDAVARFHDRNPSFNDMFMLELNGTIINKEDEYFKDNYINQREPEMIKEAITAYNTQGTPEASLSAVNDYLKNSAYKEIDTTAKHNGKDASKLAEKQKTDLATNTYKYLIEKAIQEQDDASYNYYKSHENLLPTITAKEWLDYEKKWNSASKSGTAHPFTDEDYQYINEVQNTLRDIKETDNTKRIDKNKASDLGMIYKLAQYYNNPRSKYLSKEEKLEIKDLIGLAGNIVTETTTPIAEQAIASSGGFWGSIGLSKELKQTTLPNLLDASRSNMQQTGHYSDYETSLNEIKEYLEKGKSEVTDGSKADFILHLLITFKQGAGFKDPNENVQATGLFPNTDSKTIDTATAWYLGKLKDEGTYDQVYTDDTGDEEKLNDFKDFYKSITGSNYVASEANEEMRNRIFTVINQSLKDPKRTKVDFIDKVYKTNAREKQKKIITLRNKG